MSRRELAMIWLAAAAYTAYVAAMSIVLPPRGVFGVLAFFAVSLGPLIAWSFWAVGR